MSPASKSTISFTVNRRIDLAKLSQSGKTFVQVERERAQRFIARAASDGSKAHGERRIAQSVTVDNEQQAYTTEVKIGKPPTSYTLLIDTGSSNTWVGGGKDYVPTSTSTKTSNSVSVTYGTGSFSGTEYLDRVALSSDLVIEKQSIGVASSVHDMDGINGILGVGPPDLTIGTLSPDSTTAIPTVVDNLRSQGIISSAQLGIFYEPATSAMNAPTGELTFGAPDLAKITKPINFVSITTHSFASRYWGIDQTVSYGEDVILDSAPGIVDTGTTLVLIATGAFKKYQSATGGVLDQATGLLKISETQYGNLKPLNFHVGDQVYTLIPNAQIVPRFLNTVFGGVPDAIYLVIADMADLSGRGIDFINGYAFLERFYAVYDTENQMIGLAETAFTNATTN